MAAVEGTFAAAAGECSEGKSRRATARVDGDGEEVRLLGDLDGVAGDGDSAAAAGDLSLANLPAAAELNALRAAGCCCCSGVIGSDDVPGLLNDDDDLRKLLSGASSFGESPFSIASFLSNELPSIAACFELSQLKKLVKNAGSSPSVIAYWVVSIDRCPS